MNKSALLVATLALFIFLFSSCADSNNNHKKEPQNTPAETPVDEINSATTPIATMDKYESIISEHPEFEGLSPDEIDSYGDLSPTATYGYLSGKFANAMGELPKDGESLIFDEPFCLLKNKDGEVVKMISATRVGNIITFELENAAACEKDIGGRILTADKEVFFLTTADPADCRADSEHASGMDEYIIKYAEALPDGEVFAYAETSDNYNTNEYIESLVSDIKYVLKPEEAYSDSVNYFYFSGNDYLANGTLRQEREYSDPYES